MFQDRALPFAWAQGLCFQNSGQEDVLCSLPGWEKVQNKRTLPTLCYARGQAGCQRLRKSRTASPCTKGSVLSGEGAPGQLLALSLPKFTHLSIDCWPLDRQKQTPHLHTSTGTVLSIRYIKLLISLKIL